jgi:hypothetical protein
MKELAEVILVIVGVYLILGLVFAIYFLPNRIVEVDKSVHESGMIFKLLITPGVVCFWPYLLVQLKKKSNASKV